jgi:hypothetical protein
MFTLGCPGQIVTRLLWGRSLNSILWVAVVLCVCVMGALPSLTDNGALALLWYSTVWDTAMAVPGAISRRYFRCQEGEENTL